MAHRLLHAEEMQNIRELSDFRGYWSRSPKYPRDNFGNDHVHMSVDVKYTWGNGQSEINYSSEFRAFVGSGPSDGNVDIDDTPKVRIDDFHLSFKAAFQKYFYDASDHALVISDISPKMGGRYEVRIRPNIEEP